MSGQVSDADGAALLRTGHAHLQAGRAPEAEAVFRAILDHHPALAEAHRHLGIALANQGRWPEALAQFQRAVVLAPDEVDAHNALGNAQLALGRHEAAVAAYRRALQIDPACAKAHGNLGIALHVLGRLEEAAASCRRAAAIDPTSADTYNNLGNVLLDSGVPEEAARCLEAALQRRPGFAMAEQNLATVMLLRGEIERGFALYERRLAAEELGLAHLLRHYCTRLPGTPLWEGDALGGRRLLVWDEQGLGDVIMMLRYLPLLKARGAGEITVSCRPELHRLVAALPSVDRVTRPDAVAQEAVDCHCSIMSLPHRLGTRRETIPAEVPYLHVPPATAARWVQRLAAVDGFKVGLAWAGSPAQNRSALRNVALSRLALLLAVPGARFVSLQKGALPATGLLDWMGECDDLLETAALVQQLDLVISVDTAVAHLAAALGKPVWLLNRYGSEWRWMLDRPDSPWYPTLRLFRQPAQYDWDSVIRELAAALQAVIAPGRRP